MTPGEARARAVLCNCTEEPHTNWCPADNAPLVAQVVAALAAVRQEERERCAAVAVSYAQAYMSEDTWGDGRQCGESIAAAIRAGEVTDGGG